MKSAEDIKEFTEKKNLVNKLLENNPIEYTRLKKENLVGIGIKKTREKTSTGTEWVDEIEYFLKPDILDQIRFNRFKVDKFLKYFLKENENLICYADSLVFSQDWSINPNIREIIFPNKYDLYKYKKFEHFTSYIRNIKVSKKSYEKTQTQTITNNQEVYPLYKEDLEMLQKYIE